MFLRSLACTLLLASSSLALPVLGCAQMGEMMKPAADKPLLSPAATAKVTVGSAAIGVTYNSPSMRGRVIMGKLVPYGHVWRTGANPATTITTSTDLMFGNLLVPAGTHTLYTYPSETQWLLIINKQTGQWGTEYTQSMDLGRTPMKGSALPALQENMTITFEHTSGATTQLHIKWEKTDESVAVQAE